MQFEVKLSDPKPVYQQLIDQVKMAVVTGRLKPGDRLPTVRDLAVQVRVNRNTVARVYAELESEGLLYTKSGQGTFVSDQGSRLSDDEQARQLQAAVDELVTRAKLFGLERRELIALIEDRLHDVYPTSTSRKPGGRK